MILNGNETDDDINSPLLSSGQVIEFDDGSGSVLRIQPLRTHRDEAIYECTATNNVGEINTSAKLTVLEGKMWLRVCLFPCPCGFHAFSQPFLTSQTLWELKRFMFMWPAVAPTLELIPVYRKHIKKSWLISAGQFDDQTVISNQWNSVVMVPWLILLACTGEF